MLPKVFRRRLSRFVQNARLSPLARKVRRERLTYLAPRKLLRIERALAEVRSVDGDLVEFGVALGGTATLIAREAGAGRRFFGLDVFGMIPPPGEADDAKSRERYAVIASGQAEGIDGESYYGYRDDLLDSVASTLARHGAPVDGSNVRLERGLFEESWPRLDIERLAFAHIDCDWHDPVAYCLDQAAPRLSEGGVIVIDDYHDYPGCRRAVDAFLAAHGDFRMEEGANPILRRAR